MTKRDYFKNLPFSLILGSLSIYEIIHRPLLDRMQYIILIWLAFNIFLYPIAKYALECFFSYITPLKIKKLSTKHHNRLGGFTRGRDTFCCLISFFLALPVALGFFIFKLLQNITINS